MCYLIFSNSFQVKVRYIDWGNCEIVEQSKLFQLPLSLSQPPPCAKEYELALKPIIDDENSEKFKQVSVISLNSRITAKCFYC